MTIPVFISFPSRVLTSTFWAEVDRVAVIDIHGTIAPASAGDIARDPFFSL